MSLVLMVKFGTSQKMLFILKSYLKFGVAGIKRDLYDHRYRLFEKRPTCQQDNRLMILQKS
ncbi:MAG TPA: hypothetical protein VH500_18700 [Nitrososphaeraceae archaeon]|jgi:hypothetical protein